MWYIQTIEYYLAIKRNGVLDTCYNMNTENIRNESSQTQKTTCCVTAFLWK